MDQPVSSILNVLYSTRTDMESPKVNAVNVDVCDSSLGSFDFITIAAPGDDADEKIKWPRSGEKYNMEISVSHEGPHYDDIWYNVDDCDDEISDLISFGGLSFDELVEVDELPIASGHYKLVVEFHHDPLIDWESGYDEGDDYLIILSCKRIGNLSLDLF